MKLWPMQRTAANIHSGSVGNSASVPSETHRDDIGLEEVRVGTPENRPSSPRPAVQAPRKRGSLWVSRLIETGAVDGVFLAQTG